MTFLLITVIVVLVVLLALVASVAMFYAERENKRTQQNADLNAALFFETIERGTTRW